MVFENIPINWGNKGTEPSEDIKKHGFSAGYKPPAAFHNFLFANLSDCIEELQRKTSSVDDKLTGITATNISHWNTAWDKAHEHSNKFILDTITSDDISRWNDTAAQSEGFFSSLEYVSIKEIADDIDSLKNSSVKTQYLQNVDIKTITATGIYTVDVSTCNGLPDDVAVAGCGATLIVSKGSSQNDIAYVNQYLIVNGVEGTESSGTKIYACQLYGNYYDYAWSLIASNDAVNITKYSAAPQKVGEWIDGTPVWRMAFQKEFEEIDRADKAVTISLPITSHNGVFVINAWGQAYKGAPCAVDDALLKLEQVTTFTGNDIADMAYDGIYGWIEFVTSESNLKSTA